MMWLTFVAGLFALCAATVLAVRAARRTRAAGHGLERLTLGDGYPDVGGVGPPLLLVASVGACVFSALLVAYSVRSLDDGGAPANLLGQGALSGETHASNAPTGPLKLPRRATSVQLARD